MLLGCTHCGFPVIKSLGEKLENTFCGEITRLELRNLMTRPELFIRKTDFNTTVRMPHMSDIMHPHFREGGGGSHSVLLAVVKFHGTKIGCKLTTSEADQPVSQFLKWRKGSNQI